MGSQAAGEDVVVGGLDAAGEADAGWEEHGWDEWPRSNRAPAATGVREGPRLPAGGSAGTGLEAREEQDFLYRPVYRCGSFGNR
jgi:hypothetical protein